MNENEPTRMRLRSGAVVSLGSSADEGAGGILDMERPEDSHSTDAQWGTPLTTSLSTIGSGSPARSSQQEQLEPSTSQEQEGDGNQDIYVPPSYVDDGYGAGNGQGTSSAAWPAPNLPRPALPDQNPQPESLRRFSSNTGPWNPASPTTPPIDSESLKRRFSDVAGMEDYQLDREYPDKLETELEELGGGEENSGGHDQNDSKKRKRKPKPAKRRSERGRLRNRDRDRKDDTDGNDGGMGVVA